MLLMLLALLIVLLLLILLILLDTAACTLIDVINAIYIQKLDKTNIGNSQNIDSTGSSNINTNIYYF